MIGVSVPTIRKQFDGIEVSEGLLYPAPKHGINLLIDATFFGREYGYLCFHDCTRIIYFKEIFDETNADLRVGLLALKQAGYRLKSITIDGRRGYYKTIRKILVGVPIQMCLFHMKAIIRRYLAGQYRIEAARELACLVGRIMDMDVQEFIDSFYELKQKYKHFLDQKDIDQKWHNQRVRRAFSSMERLLVPCFTYREFPNQNIPHTNNHLEGAFAHIKEKVKLHRGLSAKRKKQAIKFLISKSK